MKDVPVGVRFCAVINLAIATMIVVDGIRLAFMPAPDPMIADLFADLLRPLVVLCVLFGALFGATGVGLWRGSKLAIGSAVALSSLQVIVGIVLCSMNVTHPAEIGWTLLHGGMVGYLLMSKSVHSATM
jgi:hypothetical protein